MSEFVNYNKRNVTLPEGCKDLADVLQRKARRKIPWLKLTRTIVQPAEVTTEHKIREDWADRHPCRLRFSHEPNWSD